MGLIVKHRTGAHVGPWSVLFSLWLYCPGTSEFCGQTGKKITRNTLVASQPDVLDDILQMNMAFERHGTTELCKFMNMYHGWYRNPPWPSFSESSWEFQGDDSFDSRRLGITIFFNDGGNKNRKKNNCAWRQKNDANISCPPDDGKKVPILEFGFGVVYKQPTCLQMDLGYPWESTDILAYSAHVNRFIEFPVTLPKWLLEFRREHISFRSRATHPMNDQGQPSTYGDRIARDGNSKSTTAPYPGIPVFVTRQCRLRYRPFQKKCPCKKIILRFCYPIRNPG